MAIPAIGPTTAPAIQTFDDAGVDGVADTVADTVAENVATEFINNFCIMLL
jgi:hypothetical protein